jgi:hypothetical protein
MCASEKILLVEKKGKRKKNERATDRPSDSEKKKNERKRVS